MASGDDTLHLFYSLFYSLLFAQGVEAVVRSTRKNQNLTLELIFPSESAFFGHLKDLPYIPHAWIGPQPVYQIRTLIGKVSVTPTHNPAST